MFMPSFDNIKVQPLVLGKDGRLKSFTLKLGAGREVSARPTLDHAGSQSRSRKCCRTFVDEVESYYFKPPKGGLFFCYFSTEGWFFVVFKEFYPSYACGERPAKYNLP